MILCMCEDEAALQTNLFLDWGTWWEPQGLWSLEFLLWERPVAFFIKSMQHKAGWESRVRKWSCWWRGWFTWTCRYCRLGQSDSSCRWGPAERPAAACGCCSECEQKVGPCSLQTTFDLSRPQFCWILSAKKKRVWKKITLNNNFLHRKNVAD